MVQSGVKNETLKQALLDILAKAHSKGSDGYDKVGLGCNRVCYQHTSIGYDRARVFLMGQFYLSRQNGEYAVKDV
jgi:hypothetical protein